MRHTSGAPAGPPHSHSDAWLYSTFAARCSDAGQRQRQRQRPTQRLETTKWQLQVIALHVAVCACIFVDNSFLFDIDRSSTLCRGAAALAYFCAAFHGIFLHLHLHERRKVVDKVFRCHMISIVCARYVMCSACIIMLCVSKHVSVDGLLYSGPFN